MHFFQRIDYYFVVTGNRPVDHTILFVLFIRKTCHLQSLSLSLLESLGLNYALLVTIKRCIGSQLLFLDEDSLLRLNAGVPGLGTFGVVLRAQELQDHKLDSTRSLFVTSQQQLQRLAETYPNG